jgi:hypothetical protein
MGSQQGATAGKSRGANQALDRKALMACPDEKPLWSEAG